MVWTPTAGMMCSTCKLLHSVGHSFPPPPPPPLGGCPAHVPLCNSFPRPTYMPIWLEFPRSDLQQN